MSPLGRWVRGFLALASAVTFGAVLLTVSIGEGAWVVAGLVLVLLAATVWVGVRWGDRIGRAVE